MHKILLNRVLLATTTAITMALAACRTSPEFERQRSLLNDPRMRCAQTELIRKGYDVDPSFRRPGSLLATRQFTGGSYLKAAITARVDTTDNSFEMWTRYIRPDETTNPALPAPSGRMMLDAMEVENTCIRMQ